MSGFVTLRLRVALDSSLEVEGVTADRLARLAEREIAALPVWTGARAAQLGDFFEVRGERSARVHVEGSLTQVDGLAAGTAGGEMLIEGDAGRRVAAGITAGSVEVRGNVGSDAGLAMAGGLLTIAGNAGDRLGATTAGASRGMTGGEIIVRGSAGTGAATRARRGLVVVGGDVDADGAREMIAGTLVVFGRIRGESGRGNKRGSIVAIGGIAVPASYRYACTFKPTYLRLLFTYLQRRFGFAVDARVIDGEYRRYCGDAGIPGKGEILEWLPESMAGLER